MAAKDFLADDRAAALRLRPVSRETLGRLDGLVAQLLAWQERMNLIAPSTLPHIWSRHIADSLQLVDLAPGAARWVDLGSGGGFPGLVVACVLAEGSEVHLVESNQKKAAFLRESARILGLSARVHAQRIEDFTAGFELKVDIVSARALAPLRQLLDYAEPLMEKGAKALFLKGQDVDSELTEAARYWHMEAELVPSITDPKARIVHVTDAKRRR